jgi:HAD-hyrolase-like
VIIGDLGPAFGDDVLNHAFRQVMDGAELIALQKNRDCTRADGLSLDVGPFLAAIEFAAGRDAYVIGKPAKGFFEQALASVGVDASTAAMVGDDIESDIGGALRAGLDAIVVRTGKYREARVRASTIHQPASSTRSPTCPRYPAPEPQRSIHSPRSTPASTSSSKSAATRPPRYPGMLPAREHRRDERELLLLQKAASGPN